MRTYAITLLLLLSSIVVAQTKMRDVICQMPDSIVPYLTENNRLDFVDFIDSNMKAEVTNSLGGKSELRKLSDVYAQLVLNETSSIDMRLLDVDEPVDSAMQIVCLVRTYGSKIRESSVDFYSLRWQKVNIPLLLPDVGMYSATLGDEQPTLTIQPECQLDAPAHEDQAMVEKSSTILNWNGKTFK